MTNSDHIEDPTEQEADLDSPETDTDRAISSLLLAALRESPRPSRSLLPGIQKKIRLTTKGRYYRDRLSTSVDPVSLLLMAALLILIVAAAVFLVLQPLMETPQETQLDSPSLDPLSTESGKIAPVNAQ